MVPRPECISIQRTQNNFVIVHHYVCLSVYLGARISAVQFPSRTGLSPLSAWPFPFKWRPSHGHPSLFLLSLCTYGGLSASGHREHKINLSLSVHMAAASSTDGYPISQSTIAIEHAPCSVDMSSMHDDPVSNITSCTQQFQ